MRVVLDTSAAIAHASALSFGALEQATAILVPDVYVAEVTNAVWKMHSIGGLDLKLAQDLLHRTIRLPDSIVPGDLLYREAFQLAVDAKHAAYDMFYIALARQQSGTLMTQDKALRKLAQRYGVQTA
jgi:predicted nucleic acid-binding protein